MALVKVYDRMGSGLDLSDLSNGFGVVDIKDAPEYEVIDFEQYYSSFSALLETDANTPLKYGYIYGEDIGTGLVMEDIYYYDSTFKPVMDLDNIDIYVGYHNDPTADIWSVSMLNGHDTIIGNKYFDVIKSGFGNDTLIGNNGNDILYGEVGSDRLFGGNDQDKLFGGSGNDLLYGENGRDRLFGGNGDDKLYGGNKDDRLYGGRNDDVLKGGNGEDILLGEGGRDKMYGGRNDDVFEFRDTSESRNKRSTADRIEDFTQGEDLIDVSKIDASTILGGNDTFVFKGTTGFTTSDAGEIYYTKFDNAGTNRDYTMVYFSTDDDTGTEMAIRLTGLIDVTADDFIL